MRLPLVYHPHYSIPFPAGHRFPMAKFSALAEYLKSVGVLTEANLHQPAPMSLTIMMAAHSPDYVQRFIRGQLQETEIREIGLPWSEWLVERSLRAVSGTLLTAELALENGMACHLAGGTHHAHREHGHGFCVFNDLAVTATHMVSSGKVRRVLIVDCDVHQGDGTAAMLQNNPSVVTASWHCDKNYPSVKQPSGINVSVPEGYDDDAYLTLLAETLPEILTQAKPDMVLYDAGVDVHRDDRLGLLCLSDEGIHRRDHFVLSLCQQAGIPVAAVIGGGYDRDVSVVAKRHGILHRTASRLFDGDYDVGLEATKTGKVPQISMVRQ